MRGECDQNTLWAHIHSQRADGTPRMFKMAAQAWLCTASSTVTPGLSHLTGPSWAAQSHLGITQAETPASSPYQQDLRNVALLQLLINCYPNTKTQGWFGPEGLQTVCRKLAAAASLWVAVMVM